MKIAPSFLALATAQVNSPGFIGDVDEEGGRQTWDPVLGETAFADENFRENGALDKGHWCDQQSHTNNGAIFNLDSVQFRHEQQFDQRRYQPISHQPDFGITSSTNMDRIVGGENAKENAWKWVGYFYGCGSTLIAADWAVTAAHCCTIPAWYFRDKPLCFGRDKRLVEEEGEQCAEIAEIVQHPSYDRTETVLNDICLIRLDRKLNYNAIVQPVCLPNQGESIETLSPDVVGEQDGANNNCYVAGWGYREENQYGSLPLVLQDTKINILRNETCDSAYTEMLSTGEMIHYFRPTEMSCAGHLGGEVDACQGDSGGPMICLEESSSIPGHFNPVLRGVVSWGEGCARQGKPGVYARVSNYIDWISDTIRDRASSTADNCGDPNSHVNLATNAFFDCSYSNCKVHCKDEGYAPNLKELNCEANKKFTKTKIKKIECAPKIAGSPNLFTNCGAITSRYNIDFEKITVNCSKSKCVLKGKSKEWSPAVSIVKCSRNNWAYDGTEIKAWPKGSITKSCGPFFGSFPGAAEAGISVSCTKNACFISGSGEKSFHVEPYTKIACQRRQWRVKGKVVKSPLPWKAYSFEEYSDISDTNNRSEESRVSCGGISVWDYIDGLYSPKFRNNAKAKCQLDAKGKYNECHFYCSPTGSQVSIKFKCNMGKNSWQSPKANSALSSKLKC